MKRSNDRSGDLWVIHQLHNCFRSYRVKIITYHIPYYLKVINFLENKLSRKIFLREEPFANGIHFSKNVLVFMEFSLNYEKLYISWE